MIEILIIFDIILIIILDILGMILAIASAILVMTAKSYFRACVLRVRWPPLFSSIFKSCICAWEFHTEWRNPRRIWLCFNPVSGQTEKKRKNP